MEVQVSREKDTQVIQATRNSIQTRGSHASLQQQILLLGGQGQDSWVREMGGTINFAGTEAGKRGDRLVI